jgi:uncharacterized coiled-coil protein SlyX
MREIQHLTRLYVAWLFVCAEETKVRSAEGLQAMQDHISQLQGTMAENGRTVKELSTQIQELQKTRDKVGVWMGSRALLNEKRWFRLRLTGLAQWTLLI